MPRHLKGLESQGWGTADLGDEMIAADFASLSPADREEILRGIARLDLEFTGVELDVPQGEEDAA